ncbi:unnamed protein product [Prorocentrum cordatum]|uniref:Protein xylosyltransferase n=1 Tax=Prorocentrum cordatum TaxID=2364126 RepID=A0ABN9VBZ4_9DINO|nr:unnamed protein product [Polarella glacialis]
MPTRSSSLFRGRRRPGGELQRATRARAGGHQVFAADLRLRGGRPDRKRGGAEAEGTGRPGRRRPLWRCPGWRRPGGGGGHALAAKATASRLPKSQYEVLYGSCACDLRELECLPATECFDSTMKEANEHIALGVKIRKALKATYIKRSGHIRSGQDQISMPPFFPLGKQITYGPIKDWRQWVKDGVLASSMGTQTYKKFIDPSRFQYCLDNNLSGSTCFWKDFFLDEELGSIEEDALAHVGSKANLSDIQNISADLERFRTQASSSANVDSFADSYLLTLSHIALIHFNRQPSLTASFEQHLAIINPGVGKLRVSLHIRRADACSGLVSKGYLEHASPIDEHAQMTNVRLCYHTKVYVNALHRIRNLYGRPLSVYVASDDGKSILDEIRQLDSDFYEGTAWYHLNFSRAALKYVGSVEGQNESTNGFLGETAAADAWLLSHGDVFVGHMGSRFTKGAYLLAAARHNIPIPYISVDGHNYCCQNDEQCSKATAALTGIVDCLTFSPEISGQRNKGNYWKDGVTIRWNKTR